MQVYNTVRAIIIIANAGILPGALYVTSTPSSHLHLVLLYGIPAPTHMTRCLRNSICERKDTVLRQRAGKIVPSVGY